VSQGRCQICGKTGLISSALGACADCIRNKTEKILPLIRGAHTRSRDQFGLPPEPPRHGVRCGLCVNDCRIPPGEKGYCGLRANKDGKLIHLGGTPERGAELALATRYSLTVKVDPSMAIITLQCFMAHVPLIASSARIGTTGRWLAV